MINEAKAKVENKEDYLTENEKFLHEIIHIERNEAIDVVCESLQLALKRKGGMVAGYS